MRPPPEAVGTATPPARRRDTQRCTGSWLRPPMRRKTIGSGFRQRPAPRQKPVKKWRRGAAVSRGRAAGRTPGTACAPRPPKAMGEGSFCRPWSAAPVESSTGVGGPPKVLLRRHALVFLRHAVQDGDEPVVNDVQLVLRKVRPVRDLTPDLLQVGAVELGQGVRYGQSNEPGSAVVHQVGRGITPHSATVCADGAANWAGLAAMVACGCPVHSLTRFLAVLNQWPRHSFYRPWGQRSFARCSRGAGFPDITSHALQPSCAN